MVYIWNHIVKVNKIHYCISASFFFINGDYVSGISDALQIHIRDTYDYFESFTKTKFDHPEDREYPESPEDPESPDDPEGPEPWWPIKEEQQQDNN